jgi:serine/threonine-protein kinase
MRRLHFIRPLGSGAVGTVYLADLEAAQGFRRQVAAKVVLTSHSNVEFISRIRDEARLLGLLRDDNILKVLELATVDDRDVVLMEYVEGEDLATVAAAGHTVPPRALAELGGGLAGALHRAHTAVHPTLGTPLNVIHRDVKPANVMVTNQGGVKLLDFGVARARFAARESHTGQLVLGTLNYMAPEYIVTGDVTSAADIYALGVVLWEAATGHVLGQPKIRRDRFEQRVQEALAMLPTSHASLGRVLRASLEWEPTQRPTGEIMEKALLDAADSLSGASLRSWATSVIPGLLATKSGDVKDPVGLTGKVFDLDSGSLLTVVEPPSPPAVAAPSVSEAPAPAPPPPPRTDPSSSGPRAVPAFRPATQADRHAPAHQTWGGQPQPSKVAASPLPAVVSSGVPLEMGPPRPRPSTPEPSPPAKPDPSPELLPAKTLVLPPEASPPRSAPKAVVPAPPPKATPTVERPAAVQPPAPDRAPIKARPRKQESSSGFLLILKSLLAGAGVGLLIVLGLAIALLVRGCQA